MIKKIFFLLTVGTLGFVSCIGPQKDSSSTKLEITSNENQEQLKERSQEALPGYNPAFKDANKKIKQLWADSILYEELPFSIVATEWLNDKQPDFDGKDKGKCILYCIWTTWCPRCREFNEKMVQYAKQFKDDLVIVAISEEDMEVVSAPYWSDARDLALNRAGTIPATKFNYYVGVLPGVRAPLNVTGVPHVLIIEPEGYVVWEGNPNDREYGLNEKIIKKIIDASKNK